MEMAESSLRRLCYRMRLWVNVKFPVVLLVLGGLVVVIVVGLFLPIVGLIEGVL